jgi:hypothetical protein
MDFHGIPHKLSGCKLDLPAGRLRTRIHVHTSFTRNVLMEEEIETPDPGAMNAACTEQSSANKTANPEIPIARNANPAGVSTARMIGELPMGVKAGQSERAAEMNSASDAESSKAEYPIARNANPTGVSTSRTRE